MGVKYKCLESVKHIRSRYHVVVDFDSELVATSTDSVVMSYVCRL